MENKAMLAAIAAIFIISVSAAWFFGLGMPEENPNRHICTAEEKAAEACTMEYMPVCGSDGVTYGNKCGACAADIDSYAPGECNQTK